jgi:hypothetical protein
MIPGAHEGVLQHGQLIMVITEVVEQPENQALGYFAAGYGDRACDGGSQFVARHAWHNVQAFVNNLGQAGELHAVTDEVGAHGQHDVNGHVVLACGFEKQLEKGYGFVPGVLNMLASAKAEQFLKLVNDNEEIVMRRNTRLAYCVNKSQRATAQCGFHQNSVRTRQLSTRT